MVQTDITPLLYSVFVDGALFDSTFESGEVLAINGRAYRLFPNELPSLVVAPARACGSCGKPIRDTPTGWVHLDGVTDCYTETLGGVNS